VGFDMLPEGSRRSSTCASSISQCYLQMLSGNAPLGRLELDLRFVHHVQRIRHSLGEHLMYTARFSGHRWFHLERLSQGFEKLTGTIGLQYTNATGSRYSPCLRNCNQRDHALRGNARPSCYAEAPVLFWGQFGCRGGNALRNNLFRPDHANSHRTRIIWAGDKRLRKTCFGLFCLVLVPAFHAVARPHRGGPYFGNHQRRPLCILVGLHELERDGSSKSPGSPVPIRTTFHSTETGVPLAWRFVQNPRPPGADSNRVS
jgi:hypothetical protein